MLLGIPGVALAVVLAFTLPGDRRPNAAAAVPTIRDALSLLRIRNVWLGAIGATALIGYTITSASFLPLYLGEVVGLSRSSQITALAAFGFLGGIGGIVAPALSDRFSRKGCLLFATLAGFVSSIFLVLAAGSPTLLFVSLAFWFLGGGALTLMIYIIPGESVPRGLTATTYALLLAVGEIVGGTTTPAIGGALADRFGLSSALWFTAGLASVAVVAALATREPPRRAAGLS